MQLTHREAHALQSATRRHRNAKLQRDHELELLLNAGVQLQEALTIVDKPKEELS
jgi:hypothetical protein